MKRKLIVAFAALGVMLVPELPAAENSTAQLGAGATGPNEAQYTTVVYRHRRRPGYSSRRHYAVRRRSRRKSVAIVGGSALAGAGLGALAGGGKGAGIGAIAGGAAGFIYDRKTHKKVVRR